MASTTSQAHRVAFAVAVATGLLCSAGARAAVPSGATASLASLRQAYIGAVKSRKAAALEVLFDTSRMTPAARDAFRRHVGGDIGHAISDVVLKDPDPTLAAEYAKYHAHFPQPVIKTLKVTFVAPPGQADGSEYYIGSSVGRYYFISAVPDGA